MGSQYVMVCQIPIPYHTCGTHDMITTGIPIPMLKDAFEVIVLSKKKTTQAKYHKHWLTSRIGHKHHDLSMMVIVRNIGPIQPIILIYIPFHYFKLTINHYLPV